MFFDSDILLFFKLANQILHDVFTSSITAAMDNSLFTMCPFHPKKQFAILMFIKYITLPCHVLDKIRCSSNNFMNNVLIVVKSSRFERIDYMLRRVVVYPQCCRNPALGKIGIGGSQF